METGSSVKMPPADGGDEEEAPHEASLQDLASIVFPEAPAT
jgi:hypothetical protein